MAIDWPANTATNTGTKISHGARIGIAPVVRTTIGKMEYANVRHASNQPKIVLA